MSDERNTTGDIERRLIKLEDHVANGRHDRFFREFVQYAKEFAWPKDRARSMALSGEFAELQRKEFELPDDEFANRRRNFASQGLLIAHDIAADPVDTVLDQAAA